MNAFFPLLYTRGLVESLGSTADIKPTAQYGYVVCSRSLEERPVIPLGQSYRFCQPGCWERAPWSLSKKSPAGAKQEPACRIPTLVLFPLDYKTKEGSPVNIQLSLQQVKFGIFSIKSESETYIQGILCLLFRRIHSM